MSTTTTDWLQRFVLPLVAGGDVRVSGVLGTVELDALFAADLTFDSASDAVVGRIAEARQAVMSEILYQAPLPPLDTTALRLAAALQDLLFLLHPEAGGAFVLHTQLARVAEFALRCAALPAPSSALELAARHSILHHLFDLGRDDVHVSFWAGRRDFRGKEPPPRLLKWQQLRRVREERSRVAVITEALSEPRLSPIVSALLSASPLTDLYHPIRLEPSFDLLPLARWLRDRSIARAVIDRYLSLGLEKVGPVYMVALLALYNSKRAAGEARTATAFLCHLQLLRLLANRPQRRRRNRDEHLSDLRALCAGNDKNLEGVFALFAAAGRMGLQRPADLARDADLTAEIDEYASACVLLCGERRVLELLGLMSRSIGQMAIAS